jgi:hypothetical protein
LKKDTNEETLQMPKPSNPLKVRSLRKFMED